LTGLIIITTLRSLTIDSLFLLFNHFAPATYCD